MVTIAATLAGDAPTLIPDWDASMLAAHLVLRDGRPDAALGIAVPFLASYTEKVQRQYAAKPWPELVALLQAGPPKWSPVRIPAVAEAANFVEYFVHAEDLRRAQPDPVPYTPAAEVTDALWARVRPSVRATLRKVKMRVVLRREDGSEIRHGHQGEEIVVTGRTEELLLHAFGRGTTEDGTPDPSIVDVTVSGSDSALAAYAGYQRGI